MPRVVRMRSCIAPSSCSREGRGFRAVSIRLAASRNPALRTAPRGSAGPLPFWPPARGSRMALPQAKFISNGSSRSAKIDLQWQLPLCQNRPPVAAKSHFWPSMACSAGDLKKEQAFYLGLAKIGLRWHWKKRHRRPFLARDFAIGGSFWLLAATGGRFWRGAACHRTSFLPIEN